MCGQLCSCDYYAHTRLSLKPTVLPPTDDAGELLLILVNQELNDLSFDQRIVSQIQKLNPFPITGNREVLLKLDHWNLLQVRPFLPFRS